MTDLETKEGDRTLNGLLDKWNRRGSERSRGTLCSGRIGRLIDVAVGCFLDDTNSSWLLETSSDCKTRLSLANVFAWFGTSCDFEEGN